MGLPFQLAGVQESLRHEDISAFSDYVLRLCRVTEESLTSSNVTDGK